MQTMILPYDGKTNVYDWREGVGIIVEACKNNGTCRIGRGKNARDYYNTFLTFDIETTKLTNEHWTPKMPQMYHYFNYTYLWGVYCDDKFICGREIADFFSMLSAIQKMIAGAYLCSFVHNLAFEYFNSIDYFTNTGYEDGFFRNASTPLYIRLTGFEFRCTAQLTHKSLAQIGKDVGIKKIRRFRIRQIVVAFIGSFGKRYKLSVPRRFDCCAVYREGSKKLFQARARRRKSGRASAYPNRICAKRY